MVLRCFRVDRGPEGKPTLDLVDACSPEQHSRQAAFLVLLWLGVSLRVSVVGVAAASICLGGCGGAGRTVKAINASALTRLGGTHACHASQLRIKTFHSYAGLGTSGALIAFTNDSPATCELTGWPRLGQLPSSSCLRVVTHTRSSRLPTTLVRERRDARSRTDGCASRRPLVGGVWC